jgi:hypothetical protein
MSAANKRAVSRMKGIDIRTAARTSDHPEYNVQHVQLAGAYLQ